MYYQNQAPTGSSYEYTNESAQGKNLLITLSAGDGSITNAQWVESDWTKYWSTGARGVSAKAFIGEVLHEVAQGGLGNPQTIADQKIHTGYESYRCGRYWYGKPKYCSRATYGWSNNIRAKTRAGSGEVKSFVLNLEPNATLRIVFEGNANITNTLFNGSVSITEVPFTPLPPLVTPPAQEESPQDSQDLTQGQDLAQGEDSQESPQESAPNDTDSQDSTQGQAGQDSQGQGGDTQDQTESTPQENANPQENSEQDQTDQTDSTQGGQNAESNTEQAGMTREQALKIRAQQLAGILRRGLEYIRNNPNKQVWSDEITTTLYYHAIRMAYRNKKVGAVERDIDLNELLAKLAPAITYNDAFPVFKHIGELYTQDDEIGRQADKVITQEDYQGLCALPLPELESYGTSEGGDLPNAQSPSEQAAPSPYTQVQINAMRDIKTLFENASKNYATSPNLTCYSLADGRAIPFVHYMRDVAGLFHILTLEELSEELLNSLSFNNSSQCFNPVEKDTLPYPMEITQAINDLIDLDYQNNVFSMNYKEILAALGEQEGTIKIGG